LAVYAAAPFVGTFAERVGGSTLFRPCPTEGPRSLPVRCRCQRRVASRCIRAARRSAPCLVRLVAVVDFSVMLKPGRIVGTATVLVAVFMVYADFAKPRYQTIQTAAGRAYDVLRVERDVGTGKMVLGPDYARSEVVLVNYYGPTSNPDDYFQETQDLLGLVIPVADRYGDSVIVFQRTVPIVSRWSGFVRGVLIAYQRKPDGSWRTDMAHPEPSTRPLIH
jgi:hypothetical protein